MTKTAFIEYVSTIQIYSGASAMGDQANSRQWQAMIEINSCMSIAQVYTLYIRSKLLYKNQINLFHFIIQLSPHLFRCRTHILHRPLPVPAPSLQRPHLLFNLSNSLPIDSLSLFLQLPCPPELLEHVPRQLWDLAANAVVIHHDVLDTAGCGTLFRF